MNLGTTRKHFCADQRQSISTAGAGAYLLTEALVYIGAVVVILGIGFVAMHRAVDQSLALRRNADQISHTVSIGELWRQDVRCADQGLTVETGVEEQVLHLEGRAANVDYLFTQGGLYRRVGSGPWSRVLDKVKSSSMRGETRSGLNVWVWDLELAPETKGIAQAGRVRPWFSFIAVAPSKIRP